MPCPRGGVLSVVPLPHLLRLSLVASIIPRVPTYCGDCSGRGVSATFCGRRNNAYLGCRHAWEPFAARGRRTRPHPSPHLSPPRLGSNRPCDAHAMPMPRLLRANLALAPSLCFPGSRALDTSLASTTCTSFLQLLTSVGPPSHMSPSCRRFQPGTGTALVRHRWVSLRFACIS